MEYQREVSLLPKTLRVILVILDSYPFWSSIFIMKKERRHKNITMKVTTVLVDSFPMVFLVCCLDWMTDIESKS